MKNEWFILFLFFTFQYGNLFGSDTSVSSFEYQINRAEYLYFLDLFFSEDQEIHRIALEYIESNWEESFEILALETIYYSNSSKNRNDLLKILENKTHKKFQLDFDKWYQYIWNKSKSYTNEYFIFKEKLHELIDPRFGKYFKNRHKQSIIRLDEVRWGGVKQDGIPPLRNPEMIDADLATYLDDNNIVFGIKVNDDIRAYPKRILAWHEMFTDTVGEVPVAGVYCTLCGTVILYKTNYKGTQYTLGTSGFLYRSNKMMYDKKTQSLWSTTLGKPIIGPLVNKAIQLDFLSVVTTTWGEWKKRHPNTKVLSLNTGHRRDYGEGVAYKNYFATDKLMFTVPKTDKRLLNKDEVLVLREPLKSDKVLGIASKFLNRHPIYTDSINEKSVTIFTDKSGAHRVFYSKDIVFKTYNGSNQITSLNGDKWILKENELMNNSTKQKLKRFHSYNAFWFGFQSAYVNFRLVN